MNFNSQIATTREQSERLLALGLKPETADMAYDKYGHLYILSEECLNIPLPAWSLSRLMEMLPTLIPQHNRPYLNLGISADSVYWFMRYEDLGYDCKHEVIQENLFDAAIDMISWLIDNGHINKEYLE